MTPAKIASSAKITTTTMQTSATLSCTSRSPAMRSGDLPAKESVVATSSPSGSVCFSSTESASTGVDMCSPS